MTYSATAHGAATGRESERVSECEKEEKEEEEGGGTLIHVYPVSHALAENIPSLLPIKPRRSSVDRFGAKRSLASRSFILDDHFILPNHAILDVLNIESLVGCENHT